MRFILKVLFTLDLAGSISLAFTKGDIYYLFWGVFFILLVAGAVGAVTENDTGVSGPHRASSCKTIAISSALAVACLLIIKAMDETTKSAGIAHPLDNNAPLMWFSIIVFVVFLGAGATSLILGINYIFFASESRGWDAGFAQKEDAYNGKGDHTTHWKTEKLEPWNGVPYVARYKVDAGGKEIKGTRTEEMDLGQMGVRE